MSKKEYNSELCRNIHEDIDKEYEKLSGSVGCVTKKIISTDKAVIANTTEVTNLKQEVGIIRDSINTMNDRAWKLMVGILLTLITSVGTLILVLLDKNLF